MENMQDLYDKIDLLEKRIATTNRKIDEINDPQRMVNLAEAVQNWIINEYSPNLEKWIVESTSKTVTNMIESNNTDFSKIIAEAVQNWMVKEYSPALQEWVAEEYSGSIHEWATQEFMPHICEGVQGWVINELSPVLQNWITEKFNNDFNANIAESRSSKLASIDSILHIVESASSKPVVGRINEDVDLNEPLFIREMPVSVRPLWESANENTKEFIKRKAHLFDLRSSESIERFWESIDWKKEVPTTDVYEGLDQYRDQYERNLRTSLRNHRN
jgi:hypothetical protein